MIIIIHYYNISLGINNINAIKANITEINYIEREIEIIVGQKYNYFEYNVIQILPNFYNIFIKMEKNDLSNSIYAKNIEFILNDLKNNNKNITLKNIALNYQKIFNKKISITTVSKILKNHLNIRYFKTSIKNPKLKDDNYILMEFLFIRGIIRSLELNLNLIFIDETGFNIQNNNFHTWRRRNEEILNGPKCKVKERINLILSVSKEKIIHRKFIKGPVNSDVFLDFLNEMIICISTDELQKLMIVMDNATYHLTKDVITFFRNKKIKGLTICPYKSSFNMIELVFRFIKNITYKNVYNKIEDLKNDVIKILDGKKIKRSLPLLYKETFEQYLTFIQNKYDKDLNYIV